jgi:hypothetical protein
MIAAGANAKAISTYLGHATIGITFDRYGHLMPGNESEAADLLDSYLAMGQYLGQSAPVSGGLSRDSGRPRAAPKPAAAAAETRS